jgi:hypothetical protein
MPMPMRTKIDERQLAGEPSRQRKFVMNDAFEKKAEGGMEDARTTRSAKDLERQAQELKWVRRDYAGALHLVSNAPELVSPSVLAMDQSADSISSRSRADGSHVPSLRASSAAASARTSARLSWSPRGNGSPVQACRKDHVRRLSDVVEEDPTESRILAV